MYLHEIGLKNLRVQAFTPSDHLWSAFPSPKPPQPLNQAPPGAQQLALPDFLKVPHFEQAMTLPLPEVMSRVLTDMVVGVLAMRTRSGICPDTSFLGVHACRGIDPDDPPNMSFLLAFE